MTLGSPAHNRAALLAPALLMLAACGSTPPGQTPLSDAALAAVTADSGAPKDQLARSIDDLFTMPGLGETRAVVLLEAPHRIEALARDLVEVLPAGRLTVCRELTKQFEEIATLPVADFPAWLTAEPHRQRGEFVIVVHAQPEVAAETLLTPAQAALLQTLVQHLPVKQAAGLLADVTGLPRKALYEQALAYRTATDAHDADD